MYNKLGSDIVLLYKKLIPPLYTKFSLNLFKTSLHNFLQRAKSYFLIISELTDQIVGRIWCSGEGEGTKSIIVVVHRSLSYHRSCSYRNRWKLQSRLASKRGHPYTVHIEVGTTCQSCMKEYQGRFGENEAETSRQSYHNISKTVIDRLKKFVICSKHFVGLWRSL